MKAIKDCYGISIQANDNKDISGIVNCRPATKQDIRKAEKRIIKHDTKTEFYKIKFY